MMVNKSDTDSWKTELDSVRIGFGQGYSSNTRGKIADTHPGMDGTYRDANDHVLTRGSKSNLEVRYINPAIYTEPGEKEHNVILMRSLNDRKQEGSGCNKQIKVNHSYSKTSTINLPAICSTTKDGMSVDHAGEDPVRGQSTYRCYSTSPHNALSLEPSTIRSVVSSEMTAQVKRRCKIDSGLENVYQNKGIKREKYVLDNRQVVRISTTTSVSNLSIADCQVSSESDLARRIAHSEWVRKKYEAALRKREEEERASRKQQEEEEKIAREKEEKARLEKENFLKWMESKRQQKLDKKAMLQNELELQKRLKEIEDKAAVAKALYLRQWTHKKQEEQKARYQEQKMKERKINEERERRLEQSSKAYEEWRKNSKNKPKPATQGLLPHQKAKPTYVNPIPWQSIMEIKSDEAQENAFNEKNESSDQLKMNGGRVIAAR